MYTDFLVKKTTKIRTRNLQYSTKIKLFFYQFVRLWACNTKLYNYWKTRGPRGPWNAHLRQKIFKSSIFSLLYVQQATLGYLNLTAIVLKFKSNVCKEFSKIWWPSFWPNITHIRPWPRYCQDKHSDQVSWKSSL